MYCDYTVSCHKQVPDAFSSDLHLYSSTSSAFHCTLFYSIPFHSVTGKAVGEHSRPLRLYNVCLFPDSYPLHFTCTGSFPTRNTHAILGERLTHLIKYRPPSSLTTCTTLKNEHEVPPHYPHRSFPRAWTVTSSLVFFFPFSAGPPVP